MDLYHMNTLGRAYRAIPGSYPEMWDRLLRSDDMVCNSTCCHWSTGDDFCSIDNNFTDFYNITPVSTLELAIRYAYAVPVTILGVLGNFIIISILLQNRLLLRASVNNFILSMSVADLILAVSGPIPFTIRDTNAFWVLSPAWCHLEGYVQETVLLVSVFSLTVISLDRMLGIVRPFHRHINIFCARIIICFIWFCSAVLAVPFAIYRKYTVREWADTEEILCKETDQMNVWWLVNNVVIILSPLIIITTCYTVILVKFRKYDREIGGPEHPGLRHIKKRVVKMMFIVVIVFVVCWSPLLVFTICKKYFLETNGSVEPDKEDTFNLLLSIANYTLFLNPVADPTVYALMHENFRRALQVTYPCCFKNKSTFILTKGAGNRGFMWSTRTHPTSQVDTSRLSNQSQRSQDSLNNNRPSSRDVDRKALPSKKKTKKVWTTWTHYGSRKYPHSGRQFSYKIPKIPSTIIEASKESSERSVSYGRQETISKDYCKSLEGHTTALTGHTNTYAHASTNNSYEELSPADVSLCNGQITLFNGHIKPPNATSLH